MYSLSFSTPRPHKERNILEQDIKQQTNKQTIVITTDYKQSSSLQITNNRHHYRLQTIVITTDYKQSSSIQITKNRHHHMQITKNRHHHMQITKNRHHHMQITNNCRYIYTLLKLFSFKPIPTYFRDEYVKAKSLTCLCQLKTSDVYMQLFFRQGS